MMVRVMKNSSSKPIVVCEPELEETIHGADPETRRKVAAKLLAERRKLSRWIHQLFVSADIIETRKKGKPDNIIYLNR